LVPEDGKMELLHPLLLTEGTRTGGYADLPNSLSRHFVNRSALARTPAARSDNVAASQFRSAFGVYGV
jgi:hypothetical protein